MRQIPVHHSPVRSPRRSTRSWRTSIFVFAAALLALSVAAPRVATAAAVSDAQSFTIQPGWNAIYLEVTPAASAPATVFGGLAGVQQVWTFLAPKSSVQYINDPANGLFNVPGWKVWLPTDAQHPENASLTNLPAIVGHQAYLIKYGGTSAATLNVSGAAGFRSVKWAADSFTLTGLPVNPAAASVTAGDYFSNDPGHKSQARYYLAATGAWLPLADSAALKRGQAYWFFTKGASTYQAALDFNYGGGGSLDFGSAASQRTFAFTNRTAGPVEYTLTAPAGVPMSYQTNNSSTNVPTWQTLTTLTQTVAAGATQNLVTGVLRSQLPAGSDVGALCTVTLRGVAVNGTTPKFDSLFKVPVTVQSLGVPASAANLSAVSGTNSVAGKKGTAGRAPITNATTASTYAGLWAGTATVDTVDEINKASGSVTGGVATITTAAPRTTTPSPITLRLILHVDDSGQVQLLKQVIIMQKSSTAPVNPGAPVLITNPALIPSFVAPTTRNGSPFAPRLSSVGFDFDGNNFPLTGNFGVKLVGTVAIPRTLATHPFLHRYNPDHDDVPTTAGEVWDLSRGLTITFDTTGNSNVPGADGTFQQVGTYRENITGLHRFPIIVTGKFVLRRVDAIGALDPAP